MQIVGLIDNDKTGEIGASWSLVRAKVYKTGGRAPGRLPLTDYFKSPFAFLLLIEHKFWGIVVFVPNQRSAYFTVPFVMSYTECNFAKPFTQMSCTRTYEINFLSRSFDRPTIEESFSKMGPKKPRNREIWKGYSRKKKTISTKIRLRYCEELTP